MRKHIETILQTVYSPQEAKEMAFWIMEETLGISRSQALFRHDIPTIPNLDVILQRLLQKEPIQYIFGHTQWRGLTLHVTPDTLIPRPETSELVDLILQEHPHNDGTQPCLRVLDIGTGSGCIAIAIKKERPEWEVTALDISEKALCVARQNAHDCHTDIRFVQADILQPKTLTDTPDWDIIVSNPPYIQESEKVSMESNVLDYEPTSALFVSNDDPLLFYRKISEYKKARFLYFEINEQMGDKIHFLLESLSYRNITILRDIYGKERFARAEL